MQGSVAVVTGASSGIGRALALALAASGRQVLGVARRRDALLALEAAAEGVSTLAADLSETEGRRDLAAWLCERDLAVSHLAHSIGTVEPVARLADLSLDDWRSAFAANLEAPLFSTFALADRLESGRVLFVGSGSAVRPRPGWGAYGAAKSALDMARRCLQIEWAERGVLVASAKPGPVETAMMARGAAADPSVFPDRRLFETLREEGKVASPETAARFLRWLLLDCPAKDFVANDWRMADPSHHAHWLEGDLYTRGAAGRS